VEIRKDGAQALDRLPHFGADPFLSCSHIQEIAVGREQVGEPSRVQARGFRDGIEFPDDFFVSWHAVSL